MSKLRERIHGMIIVYLRTFTYIWINQQQYVSVRKCVCEHNLFAYENLNIIRRSFKVRNYATGMCLWLVVGVLFQYTAAAAATVATVVANILLATLNPILRPHPLTHCWCQKAFSQVPSDIRFSPVNWTLHRNHKFIEINLITSMPVFSLPLSLWGKCVALQMHIT